MAEVKASPGERRAGEVDAAGDRASDPSEPAADTRDGAPTPERMRAARYLDLWEQHVGDAAAHGKGISAPWFSR